MGDTVHHVEISSLKLGATLGSGGQGKVVAVDNYLIDARWPAALKTYGDTVNVSARGLEKIAAFPDQLHRNDREWLMGVSSWPWAIAMDNGTARGFLMRVVPSVYRFNFMTVTQGSTAKLSTVEYVLNTDDYVSRAGISISEKDRLNLLCSLAEALSRLHALGVVIGDLSPKNLLFNLSSYASCFFIDCDAVAVQGESALEQVDTPEWEVPAGEEKGTEVSDAYKFGLLAIRLFARDQSSRDASAVSALSAELGRLATLSQDHNSANRPTPGSWVSPIQSAVSCANATQTSAGAAQPSASQPNPGATQGYRPYAAYSRPQPAQTPAPGTRPPVARPPRRHGSVIRVLTFSGAGLIALLIVIISMSLANKSSGISGSGASSGNSVSDIPSSGSAQSSPSAPVAPPTNVGVVGIGNSISADPAATAVARMFNTYFTAINAKDYQRALSVFDPSGIIDPNNSSQVQQFTNGVRTTTDSAATLVNIQPSHGSTVQSAEVQFTSQQQAGYGPRDDPNATCTNWDVTYTLSQDSSGSYLINNVSGSSDSAC